MITNVIEKKKNLDSFYHLLLQDFRLKFWWQSEHQYKKNKNFNFQLSSTLSEWYTRQSGDGTKMESGEEKEQSNDFIIEFLSYDFFHTAHDSTDTHRN